MKPPYFIIICAIIILTSCEYNLVKENNKDIASPKEEISFIVNLDLESDTLFFSESTILKYDINTFGLDISGDSFFKLGGFTHSVRTQLQGEFTFIPPEDSYIIDTLKLTVATTSGTGSLAESLGVENYLVQAYWIVVIDTRKAPYIKLNHRINEDGLLEMYWNKSDNKKLEYYELVRRNGPISAEYYYPDYSKRINDIKCTTFVDSSYCGGRINYKLMTKLQGDDEIGGGSWTDVRNDVPNLRFKNKGLDSLVISWSNIPVKSTYTLKYKSYNTYYQGQATYDAAFCTNSLDTSVTISYPLFSFKKSLKLSVSPFYETEVPTWHNSIYAESPPSPGELMVNVDDVNYCYNSYSKHLFISKNSYLSSVAGDDLDSRVGFLYHEVFFTEMSASPNNSKKVAFYNESTIYCFEDETLKSYKEKYVRSAMREKVPYAANYNVNHFLYTNNNKIALSFDQCYAIFDVTTLAFDTLMRIDNYPYRLDKDIRNRISSSQDGKFFSIVSDNLRIYTNDNGTIALHHVDSKAYNSCYFNPTEPSELFVIPAGSNKLEVHNVEDFSLVKEVTIPSNCAIEQIDPISGLLLLTDKSSDSYIYVVDLDSGEIKFSSRYRPYQVKLINRKLYSRNGQILDIIEYL